MEPTTQSWIAIGVLALLLCLRRRRTGDCEPPASNEEARAADEAFVLCNTSEIP